MNADVVKRKYFTVAKANQMLPLVRAIVSDIVELFQDLSGRRERLLELQPEVAGRDDAYAEEVEQMERELEQDVGRLQGFVDELLRLGVEFKDPVAGLVDFPTRINGHDAYLCWKLGEGEIAHWHDLESGFGGRQPLRTAVFTEILPEEDEE